MYTLSLLTGKEYYNGILIPQDDINELFQQRCDFLENGGQFEIIESTPEEIAEQTQAEQLRKETEMYKKRTQDGINAYAEISAEFRLAKLSGILTEEQHVEIESILIPVRNEVLAGQWISARQKLEGIGVVIGVQLYTRLHTQISNYINENY